MRRRPLLLLPLLSAVRSEGKRLRVGVEDFEYFLPYSSYNGRSYRGLGRDLLDAYAAERGLEFEFVALPIKRRLPALFKGEVDLVFPDHPRWHPELKAGQPAIAYAPMLDFTDGVMVRPSLLGQGLARLRVLGIPNGFTPYPYEEPIRAGRMRIEEIGRLTHLYERLQLGTIDGAYMNVRITRYFFAHHAPAGLELPVFDPALPHATGQWHLGSLHQTELVEDFRSFLQSRTELVAALQKRWQWQ